MPKYRHIQLVVPPAEHDVTVMNAKLEHSKKSGNEMITLRLTVPGGSISFFDHLVFEDNSYWKIAQFLTAMGEEIADDQDINPNDYVNRTARAVVGVRE